MLFPRDLPYILLFSEFLFEVSICLVSGYFYSCYLKQLKVGAHLNILKKSWRTNTIKHSVQLSNYKADGGYDCLIYLISKLVRSASVFTHFKERGIRYSASV